MLRQLILELMLILPGKVHSERSYRDLKDEVLVGLSGFGYANVKRPWPFLV
jgi:hypothetical protein